MAGEAGADLGVRRLAGGDAGVHDEIHVRQFLLAVSKRFTCETLQAISIDGVPGGLDADGESEARASERIGASNHEKQRIGRPLTFTVNGVELGFVGEAARAGKAARAERKGGALRGNGQTARRLRPFARRRLSTRRPPFVAMRARKPWTRLRCRLLGL
jgi:hypothetical protein